MCMSTDTGIIAFFHQLAITMEHNCKFFVRDVLCMFCGCAPCDSRLHLMRSYEHRKGHRELPESSDAGKTSFISRACEKILGTKNIYFCFCADCWLHPEHE